MQAARRVKKKETHGPNLGALKDQKTGDTLTWGRPTLKKDKKHGRGATVTQTRRLQEGGGAMTL